MKYSIVIPVFNKAALTRQCLSTLRATLDGAGDGEVIVIDNASSDETPAMLREFDWISVVRNETNLGFAGANNQGARMASGEYLVLLNNDIIAHPGWLAAMLDAACAPGAGIVGARLLYPDGRLQHAGVYLAPLHLGGAGFYAAHDLAGAPGDTPYARERREYQAVTGACLVTPRALYLESGGLDEGYWNGYEDVDYCMKVRARGLHIVYAGDAVLTHFESQSGPQRFRKLAWNIGRLADRWNGRVHYDMSEHYLRRGFVRRNVRVKRGNTLVEELQVPKTTVLVHGDTAGDATFTASLHANTAPVEEVIWCAPAQAVAVARRAMERRGDRYLAFVDARCRLEPGWLDELVRQVEWGSRVGAATAAPELPASEECRAFTADARCTLIALRRYPRHERLDPALTLDGAVADFLIRGLAYRAAVRGVAWPVGALPAPAHDAAFELRHGRPLTHVLAEPDGTMEEALRGTPRRRNGLISIVMLSWNAVEFTRMALESIRNYTSGEYEVIIVDNGSKRETVDWLHTLRDVHVIYNESNRGYAGGNNQALAVARGEYVVLLNNDVIVTEGWLDGLLSAFDRVPGLGISAPRSNIVAGDQVVSDGSYGDMEQMHAYARARRERYRGRGYITDRAIGLCLCIDRRVIEEIGGIDEQFGVGNFEDDDFCLRVRAAGYGIYVCDDVFIHHFGSQTFSANNVDWNATMRSNWSLFARKWGLSPQYTGNGYVPAPLIRRGFDPERHVVPLPSANGVAEREYRSAFCAIVRSERDWNVAGAFARRYFKAFQLDDATVFAIAATGELSAQTLGERLRRIAEREGLDAASVADVCVSDEEPSAIPAWLEHFEKASRWRIAPGLDEGFDALPFAERQSPSELRRIAGSLAER